MANQGVTYKDYYDFVYLNTNMPKMDTRLIVNECWNKGLDKYQALKEARKLYGNNTIESFTTM